MNDLFYKDLFLIQNDKRQFEAYNSMSNTVLIAGPGSGKTRVLSLKAVSLSKTQINKPEGLACISFSRESVRELKARLKKYGYTSGNKDFIGTVHSFSLLHVIQPFAHLYPEYNISYPIKIIPHELSIQIYQTVLEEMGLTDGKSLQLGEINKHRTLALSGRSDVKINSTELIAEGAERYEKHLRATEFLDFTSIINISATIIREQEFVRKTLQCRFPWLLVDEYQDLGKALHEMVLELVFNAGMKLYAVGDENQSIYGFNGGYPDFLLELTNYDDIFPIYLEANYRSSQHIISASLETLQPKPPFPKYIAQKRIDDLADFTFIICDEDMNAQYQVVAYKVIPKLLTQGIALNEIGIIADSNSETIAMAQALQTNGIPFFIAKWSFENSAIIVWLQECAAWCTDTTTQPFEGLFKFWKNLLINHEDNRKNLENIQLKVLFHKAMCEAKSIFNTLDWIIFVIEKLDLKTTILDSDIYPNEIKNFDYLIDEARLHNLKNTKIERFASLGSPNNEVTITTRHSSKGLEFETVIMLGMEETRFPSWRNVGNPIAIAEEQRLCYVCVSRAKKSCILLRSLVYNIVKKDGDIWRKAHVPSRFWVNLHTKFGDENNSFTAANFK
jgi:DNA helicase-2/ATP-dependent DNA helicase PcrA